MQGRSGKLAFTSLIANRIIYSVNWLNIASVFPGMAREFGEGVSGLGLLTAIFYLSVGIFQIPGGILAAKIGPKRTATLGTFLFSSAVLSSGFANNFTQITILRFIVGIGMAFVFSPGVSLITRHYRAGKEGLAIGIYNSAFDVGGALGLFLWAIMDDIFGWRISIILSGSIALITAFIMLAFVPEEKRNSGIVIKASKLSAIFSDRDLLILSIALLAIGIGNSLIGSFTVYYAESSFKLSPFISGLIASQILFIPIFSSPLGGRIYDRTKRPRELIFYSGVLMSLALLLAAISSPTGIIVCSTLGGFAAGIGFTSSFSAAREINKLGREFETLAIAWTNSISLFGNFWAPLVFSYVADRSGYSFAWLVGGFFTLLLSSPIIFLRKRMQL